MSWLTEEAVALLLSGIKMTVVLTLLTTVLSLLSGILIGSGRLAERRLFRTLSTLYVELFRNIPALVLIIFLAFAVPNIFSPDLRRVLFFDNRLMAGARGVTGLSLPYYALAAVAGLTLNTAAYIAELFRAGVGTIPRNMIDAARSLGAGQTAVFRRILVAPRISGRLSGDHHTIGTQHEKHRAGLICGCA